MYIDNVTLDDDSLKGALGSYECHAFAVGDVNERARHGFSVSVIGSKSYMVFWFTVVSRLYIKIQAGQKPMFYQSTKHRESVFYCFACVKSIF